eukprot:jgi/Tetstr1/426858/TSEL_017072.t1
MAATTMLLNDDNYAYRNKLARAEEDVRVVGRPLAVPQDTSTRPCGRLVVDAVLTAPEAGVSAAAHTCAALGQPAPAEGGALPSGPAHDLTMWDAGSGRLLARLRGHTGHRTGLAYSADGACIARCSGEGSCRVWQFSCIHDLMAKHEGAAEL